MKFFIGTTNPYKVRELAGILRPLEIDLEVTDSIDPEETANTFDGNAKIKAVAYSKFVADKLIKDMTTSLVSEEEARKFLRLSNVWTVSEDSGIEIPALSGLPGPYSARFSDFANVDEEKGTLSGYSNSGLSREEIDLKNNQRVLELVKGYPQPWRSARFVVSLKVANINGFILFSSESYANGWIADEPRGDNGFGYDPIFISPNSFGKTWAEIDSMRKNLISHRRTALKKFTMWLATELKKDHDRTSISR